jgi:hypothetical protein
MTNEEMTSSNNPPNYDFDKASSRLFFLKRAVDEVFLQIERIQFDRAQAGTKILKTLFADIHFFLVAVTNVMECLKSLKSIIKSDQELNKIYKKYLKPFEHLNTFRDHIEHITDGRIDGFGKKSIPLKNPGMLGNLWGDKYDFGGETFNISESFSMLEEFYRELKEWNDKNKFYPL